MPPKSNVPVNQSRICTEPCQWPAGFPQGLCRRSELSGAHIMLLQLVSVCTVQAQPPLLIRAQTDTSPSIEHTALHVTLSLKRCRISNEHLASETCHWPFSATITAAAGLLSVQFLSLQKSDRICGIQWDPEKIPGSSKLKANLFGLKSLFGRPPVRWYKGPQKDIPLRWRTLDRVQPQLLFTARAKKFHFAINLLLDAQSWVHPG